MSTTTGPGRLCNQVIRNLALSVMAKKHNLYVRHYNMVNPIEELGIILFNGTNKFRTSQEITTENYTDHYNKKTMDYNCCCSEFYQSEACSDIIYKHLQSEDQLASIKNKNPFKDRYDNNNDLFIHIRLGDVPQFNPGVDYYINCIKRVSFDKLYIASDDFHDKKIVKRIQSLYPDTIFVDKSPVQTIQFGSTCKHIILSHGSFSAVIGYLSVDSHVYYSHKEPGWCPLGMFTNKSWHATNK